MAWHLVVIKQVITDQEGPIGAYRFSAPFLFIRLSPFFFFFPPFLPSAARVLNFNSTTAGLKLPDLASVGYTALLV